MFFQKIFFFIFLFCFTVASSAQTRSREYAEAEELLQEGKYGSALNLYLQLLRISPESAILNYKIGLCYLHSRSQPTRATAYFEKAMQNTSALNHLQKKENDPPNDLCKLLGDACFNSYKFEQAISAYERYKEVLQTEKNKDETQIEAICNKIETCRFALELKELSAQKPWEIPNGKTSENLKKNIQSPGNYTSALSADKSSTVFAFQMPANVYKKKPEDLRFFEEENIPQNRGASKTSKISADSAVFATTVGTAIDGQAILTYKNENGKSALYLSYLRNNRWTFPQKLSEPSNQSGWEPSESLSPDGNLLYFTSERNGGYGGRDIYYCMRNRNGNWSKAKNAGPYINSPYDEVAPFIHPDGSLYFSSNRNFANHFEIFSAQISDSGKWKEPMNIGFPVEQKQKEVVAFTVNPIPSSKSALHENSSPSKKDTSFEHNHHLASFVSPELKSLAVLSGKLMGLVGTSSVVSIGLIDNSDESLQAIYYAGKINPEFAFVIPPDKSIAIFYEAPEYLFVSENITIERGKEYFLEHDPVHLSLLIPGALTQLNNVFFKEGTSEILPASEAELNKIALLMKNHPAMRVQLNTYVYSKTDKRNKNKLSRAMAESLKKTLEAKGVSENRIVTRSHRHKKIRSIEEKNNLLHEKRNYLITLKIRSVE